MPIISSLSSFCLSNKFANKFSKNFKYGFYFERATGRGTEKMRYLLLAGFLPGWPQQLGLSHEHETRSLSQE